MSVRRTCSDWLGALRILLFISCCISAMLSDLRRVCAEFSVDDACGLLRPSDAASEAAAAALTAVFAISCERVRIAGMKVWPEGTASAAGTSIAVLCCGSGGLCLRCGMSGDGGGVGAADGEGGGGCIAACVCSLPCCPPWGDGTLPFWLAPLFCASFALTAAAKCSSSGRSAGVLGADVLACCAAWSSRRCWSCCCCWCCRCSWCALGAELREAC